MMKRIVAAALLGCMIVSADGLYTDTYMSRSGIVRPVIKTGIPNSVKVDELMKRQIFLTTPLYFRGGVLDERSADALRQILSTVKELDPRSYRISVIGHTAGYTSEEHMIRLNWWSSFWQNISNRTMSRDRLAVSVNARIRTVYDMLKNHGVSPAKIYTENRMDRDPISTEATPEGRRRNERVTVTLYR
ncbi:MAG TPA: hypothetical protein ENK71_02000 [Epsilonproteobacteria bacterium]|nr:hypothetical protein [Campylobacterota bacterium]